MDVRSRIISALSNLDFPIAVVDQQGTLVALSRTTELLFPVSGSQVGKPLGALLASRPESFPRWLEEAQRGLPERLLLEESAPSALFVAKAVPLGAPEEPNTLWVVHFHTQESPIRRRHEREIMLRITSVPISTLMEETEPLSPEAPERAPITHDVLQMILHYLGGEAVLLFCQQNQPSPVVVGQAGFPRKNLAELLAELEREHRAGRGWEGVVAEAAGSGLVYTLPGGEPGDAFIARLQAHLPFPCAEVWVDGIGGYGATVAFFRQAPDRDVRAFSTESFVRLGRHLESASYSRRMWMAFRELQRTQERIIQTGKLAALGEMAAGIAHELRQPVTAINNFMSNIFNLLAENQFDRLASRLAEYEERSRRNVDRLSGIIDHLRTFARQDELRFHPTDLRVLLDEMYQTFFTNQLLSQEIEVVWAISPELPLVELDPQRIEQVILNLISNARDAVEGRPHPRIVIGVEPAGERIRIFVEDNGPGIPEAIRPKILDPFFSTKPVGKGTGLGLSISHGIVENHHGEIEIANNPGGGARFSVYLPVKQSSAASHREGG